MSYKNFYNNIYYYTPKFYPGFLINKKQEQTYISQFPYINKDSKPQLDLQIFYNITDDNNIPWGSTYKYTIPKSIDDNTEQAHSSISERQKRFRREHFNGDKNDNYYGNIDLFTIIIIVAIIYFIMCQ